MESKGVEVLQESEGASRPPRSAAAEIEALRREIERLRVLAKREHGLLEAIVNHSPHGILVCDAAGKLTLQNRASERIWAGSATADTVDGWQAYRGFHADGRAYAPGDWAMARCLSDGEVIDPHEIDIQRFDGTRGVLLGSCAPIRGEDGKISGAVSVFADITRFKELESELRAAYADTDLLYRLTDAVVRSDTVEEIFEHALAAVVEGLRTARASILVFDEANVMRFRAWRGLSADYRAAVDGHSPWTHDVVDPEPIVVPDVEVDATMDAYRAIFRAEDIRALGFFPLVHRRRLLGKFMVYAPTPRTFSERDVRLAAAIGAQVAYAVARRTIDLENARLLEEATAARAEAERAVHTRDELLAIVSHDLRNPVNTLTLSAMSLMTMATRQEDQKLLMHGQRMQRSLATMNRLIGDLLDVAAIDGGSLQVQPKDSELSAIANDAVDLMRPLVEERKQQLVVEVTPGLRVVADPERILQILSNILGNATKFTPVGGRISLCGAAIEQDGRRFVEVTVTDSGPGIARENLPRIFDRFWKSSQDHQGVGLGLAIAKGVVEAHGGRIGVDSPPGGGATFRFTLPTP